MCGQSPKLKGNSIFNPIEQRECTSTSMDENFCSHPFEPHANGRSLIGQNKKSALSFAGQRSFPNDEKHISVALFMKKGQRSNTL